MLERGTYLVPTLAVIHFVIESASEALGEETLQRAREVAEVHHENIRAARRAGVPITAGTDVGNPFVGPDATHQEIALFTDIGMSNHEAIQAATLLGARAIGVEDDLGTVRPGRRADLLVLDGAPSTTSRRRGASATCCRTARSASVTASRWPDGRPRRTCRLGCGTCAGSAPQRPPYGRLRASMRPVGARPARRKFEARDSSPR